LISASSYRLTGQYPIKATHDQGGKVDIMASGKAIRLLLATSFPEVEEAVRRALTQAGLEARIQSFPSTGELFEFLEHKSAQPAPGQPPRACADLIVFSEDGLPGRAAERVGEACARLFDGPVILLGSASLDRSRLHLLRRPAPNLVLVEDVQHLPVTIERVLLEREHRQAESRMRAEILRAADTVGQSQKLVTMGRLAGSIAHEINNPLESITNLLYLIAREQGLPVQAQKYLALAQAELKRVVEISKQTLTFSRETAQPTLLLMPDLLEEVLSLYTRRITEKNIHVQREYESHAQILAHPGEIRQVFSNLVSNSLEAMEPGGRLRLRVRDTREQNGQGRPGLRISVADTGTGIPQETRRRLGEPFFTTKGQSGTGLGLWVTQTILRRHGGTLRLRSRTGRDHGTVFTVFLPAASCQASNPASDESHCLPFDRPSGARQFATGKSHPVAADSALEPRVIGY
jgi:two-component system NtrC family sensor kinase